MRMHGPIEARYDEKPAVPRFLYLVAKGNEFYQASYFGPGMPV